MVDKHAKAISRDKKEGKLALALRFDRRQAISTVNSAAIKQAFSAAGRDLPSKDLQTMIGALESNSRGEVRPGDLLELLFGSVVAEQLEAANENTL